MKNYRISSDLFLVEQSIEKQQAIQKSAPVSHIVVLDCSGSMSCDLPHLRENLKKKLPKLLGKDDLLSIIWFSGRDQFGTLLEAEPVATLVDLAQINAAIDRWLKPIGLTGFLQPLQEAGSLIKRVHKAHPEHVSSLIFSSDGHDNCSVRADVLKAISLISPFLSSATFVEYGYYADRPLLASMAEKASGTLIFSEDFDRYAPQFEAAMQKRPVGVKRVEVPIFGDVIGGFAFAMRDGDLLTFAVEAGKAQVPEGVSQIWYVLPKATGEVGRPIMEIAEEFSRSLQQSGSTF